MAQAPANSPNHEPMSMEQYLKFLQEMDELDLEEPDEVPQCFMCKQECLEVFAKQIKFASQRDFCSSECFRKYTKLKKDEVKEVPKPSAERSPASAPISIERVQSFKGAEKPKARSK